MSTFAFSDGTVTLPFMIAANYTSIGNGYILGISRTPYVQDALEIIDDVTALAIGMDGGHGYWLYRFDITTGASERLLQIKDPAYETPSVMALGSFLNGSGYYLIYAHGTLGPGIATLAFTPIYLTFVLINNSGYPIKSQTILVEPDRGAPIGYSISAFIEIRSTSYVDIILNASNGVAIHNTIYRMQQSDGSVTRLADNGENIIIGGKLSSNVFVNNAGFLSALQIGSGSYYGMINTLTGLFTGDRGDGVLTTESHPFVLPPNATFGSDSTWISQSAAGLNFVHVHPDKGSGVQIDSWPVIGGMTDGVAYAPVALTDLAGVYAGDSAGSTPTYNQAIAVKDPYVLLMILTSKNTDSAPPRYRTLMMNLADLTLGGITLGSKAGSLAGVAAFGR